MWHQQPSNMMMDDMAAAGIQIMKQINMATGPVSCGTEEVGHCMLPHIRDQILELA